jgi:hypothetical protein
MLSIMLSIIRRMTVSQCIDFIDWVERSMSLAHPAQEYLKRSIELKQYQRLRECLRNSNPRNCLD